MGNIAIRISVENVDDVTEDIEDAIKRGIQKGGHETLEHAKHVAKTHIRAKAHWTGQLLHSWSQQETAGKAAVYQGILENTAPHAAPVEHGSDYGTEGPPVEALIPWVRSEMNFVPPPGWRPEGDSMDPEALDRWNDVTNFVTDPMTLRKAFWLQQHIKEEGISAVHYARDGRLSIEAQGDQIVAKEISKRLNRDL